MHDKLNNEEKIKNQKRQPLLFLSERHEILYNDLVKEKCEGKSIETIYYKKINNEEEKRNFFCFNIKESIKEFDFNKLVEETHNKYKKLEDKDLNIKEVIDRKLCIEKLQRENLLLEQNKIIIRNKRALQILCTAVYKDFLIICDENLLFYKLLLNKVNKNKKSKSTFFDAYKIKKSEFTIKKDEFSLNFNKKKILLEKGMARKTFQDLFNTENIENAQISDLKYISHENSKLIFTYKNDPIISECSCIEINIERKIRPKNLKDLCIQLEEEVENIKKYKHSSFLIKEKRSYSVKKSKNKELEIQLIHGLHTFLETKEKLIENFFDEFCLKNGYSKKALKNFKKCECLISLENNLQEGIYENYFLFDLKEEFGFYFFNKIFLKDFSRTLNPLLFTNLISFIYATFCKEFVNEIYREFLKTKKLEKDDLIFNFSLFVKKSKKRNKKFIKKLIFLNEHNFILEEKIELKMFEKENKENNTKKKYEGKIPKGFINLYFKMLKRHTKKEEIEKEDIISMMSLLKKVSESDKFNIKILSDYLRLINLRMDLFELKQNKSEEEGEIEYLFCECGYYKIKDRKCFECKK